MSGVGTDRPSRRVAPGSAPRPRRSQATRPETERGSVGTAATAMTQAPCRVPEGERIQGRAERLVRRARRACGEATRSGFHPGRRPWVIVLRRSSSRRERSPVEHHPRDAGGGGGRSRSRPAQRRWGRGDNPPQESPAGAGSIGPRTGGSGRSRRRRATPRVLIFRGLVGGAVLHDRHGAPAPLPPSPARARVGAWARPGRGHPRADGRGPVSRTSRGVP